MYSRDRLLAQARRRYLDFLHADAVGAKFFPLALRIGKSRRAENYAERAAELAEFRAATDALGITVEWREVNDPRFGPHERPERAFFASEEPFLQALGKVDEVRHFREDLAHVRAECPELATWLAERPQVLVARHGAWPELLRVVQWFRANPRSGLYLRQIPVEGVDTKFFEAHRPTLDAMLTLLAGGDSVDLDSARFEARHGLRWEQPLIRLRFLDPQMQAAHGFPIADLAVPAHSFREFEFAGATVIITENLRNFLALPSIPHGIAVQGGGDAVVLIADAKWLAASRILYWGDLDPRGFSILARLRHSYPHTESMLMDEATLDANLHLAVAHESSDVLPVALTTGEQRTLERLHAARLRLEQERIPFPAVVDALSRAAAGA